MRARNFLLWFLAVATPAAAQRQSLGIFSLWGAFREGGRCYAVAEPDQASAAARGGRPFASVSWAPGLRGQLHVRLSRAKRSGSAVLLRIGDRTFQLIGGGDNAWAPDAAADAEIVGAMRGNLDMTVETRSQTGALVRDHYALRGAATAIDAAAIGCAPRPR
jgi:hypothetical protein